jgi:tetratricopeptide (TPR) repeat protein
MRRVVFVGNCQAQALTDAFNRFVAPFTGERAFHVPAFRDNDEAHRAALERADVIVELVFDFSRRSDPADLGLTAPVIAAPYVNCQFLWPYAYEAHPRSARSEFSDSGPYPIQLSDAFLNRLMREGVPEEEAAARYLDLDINQKVRLDRRLEMTLALQRQRDEKTGFAVADLMERYFREEPIFLTPYHPNRRIFLHVVERCFARLGVAEHLIARLPRLIRRSLFLQDALPVHPRLAAHFGLVWANEATRYPFWLDGDFTFAEFIGRYLRFDWCEDFARGHYHARQGQNAEAIARLRAGLGAYPEADRAWVLLSHVYTAEGALPEALAAAREAVSRNPRDGEYFAHLGNLLTNAGEVASARVAYERAVALEPEHTPWLRLLAGHWERQGKRAEAGALVATLADKDPLDYELHVQRGHLLAGRGDNAGAVMAFSHALGLAPHIEGVRAARSHTLAALERWEEAIADARAALAETPENRDLRRHLDNLLRASGDAAGAEAAFRKTVQREPSHPEPYRQPDGADFHAHLRHIPVTIGESVPVKEIICSAVGVENEEFRRLLAEVSSPVSDMSPAHPPLSPSLQKARKSSMESMSNPTDQNPARDRMLQALWKGRDPFIGFPAGLYKVDVQGWNSDHPYLHQAVSEIKPSYAVEIGVWKGASTMEMARKMKELQINGVVIAVDTWLGSWEHWLNNDYFDELCINNSYPNIFYKFMTNVLGHDLQKYVLPLPIDSLNAAKIIEINKFELDIIHLDAGHDYVSVSRDLSVWWPLLRVGGILIGDDYNLDGTWPEVRAAFDDFFGKLGIFFENLPGKCLIRKSF